MSPLDWAKLPLFKYADFSGRASRPEFWWFVLANVILSAVCSIIESIIGLRGLIFGLFGPLTAVVAIALLSPSLTVAARRLHDTGRSGLWLLLGLIPFAGLAIVYFQTLEGEFGQNAYGAPPQPTPGR